MAPNPGNEPHPVDAPKPLSAAGAAAPLPPRRVSMMDVQRTDVSSRRIKRRLSVLVGALVLAGAVVVAVLRLGPSVPTLD